MTEAATVGAPTGTRSPTSSATRVRSGNEALEDTLNHRPRKTLGYRTPHEFLFGKETTLMSGPLMRLGWNSAFRLDLGTSDLLEARSRLEPRERQRSRSVEKLPNDSFVGKVVSSSAEGGATALTPGLAQPTLRSPRYGTVATGVSQVRTSRRAREFVSRGEDAIPSLG